MTSRSNKRPAVKFESLKPALSSLLETADYWKKIFWFIGVPIIGLTAVNAYFLETKHMEHLEEHPVNQVPYDYLKIRSKVENNVMTDF